MSNFFIPTLVAALGGVFLVSVTVTLYRQRSQSFFWFWALAWLSNTVGLLAASLLLAGQSSESSWSGGLAAVCSGWFAVLWLLGIQRFAQSRDHAGAPAANDSPRPVGAEPPFSREHLAALLVVAGLAWVVSQRLPWYAAAMVLAAVLTGVYAWSTLVVARIHRRQPEAGTRLLAVVLALFAVEQLHAAMVFLLACWTGDLPGGTAFLGLIDFLLETFLVVAFLVMLLAEEGSTVRETRRRLGESEDHFRLVFEHSGVGMAVLSPEGVFLQINPALVRLLGYDAKELSGRRLVDLAHPDEVRDGISRSEQGLEIPPDLYEREKRYLRKDGTEVKARVVRVPLRDMSQRVRYIVGVLLDITEQRRAEEALAASEQRYRLRFQAAFDGLNCCSESGEFFDANPAFCRMLGYTSEELAGLTVADVADNLPLLRRHFSAVLANGGDSVQTRLRRKDGSQVDVEVHSAGIELSGRRLVHSVSRDITERKRADSLMAGKKRVLEQIVTGTPLPEVLETLADMIEEQIHEALCCILLCDETGKPRVAAAPRLPDRFRKAIEEQTGARSNGAGCPVLWRRDTVLVPDLASDPLRAPHHSVALASGLRACWSRAILGADGAILGAVDIYLRAPRGPAPGETSLMEVATHLAGIAIERKRAEDALLKRAEVFRALFDLVPLMLAFYDAEDRFEHVNPAWERGLGWSLAEARAHDMLAELYPDPNERAAALRFMNATEGKFREFQVRVRDGRRLSQEWATVRLPDGRTVSIGRDTSERKLLEDQLRQAHKMEAIGQLAGGIAHDFNNLLTGILGNVSLVLSRLPAADPRRGPLEVAENAGLRAADLTRRLLGFARRSLLRPEPLDANLALEESLRMFRPVIDPRIVVEVQPDSDLWSVCADRGQLNQLVMNLCLNARDAMPEGGRLCLRTDNVVLPDGVTHRHPRSRPGQFVRLRVQDTGQGIPAENLSRIFDPFFTTKGPGHGTGLGLAMVFGIAEQHQGWIECISALGQGSCFDLYLPRSVDEPAAPPAPPVAPECSRGGETVLVVDDEEVIRYFARVALEGNGYQVLLAEDGLQGLEIYQREKERIQLVILDLRMPHLSGQDTLRRLLELDPGARVLLASGYTAESVTEADHARALGFLAKPFHVGDLLRAVRAALDGRLIAAGRV